MSDEESSKRGCAGFFNLIISGILLVLVLSYFFSGVVNWPEWLQSLANVQLLQSRQLLRPAIAFGETDTAPEEDLLLINVKTKNQPLREIIRDKRVEEQYQVLATFKNKEASDILWEQILPNSQIGTSAHIRAVADQSTVYIADQETLRAYQRNTGEEVWTSRLSDRIDSTCTQCLQLSENGENLLVLSQDRMLYSLELKFGRVTWKKRLNTAEWPGLGFYQSRNRILLTDQTANRPQDPVNLWYWQASAGELDQKTWLSGMKTTDPLWESSGVLYYINQVEKELRLQALLISSGEKLWSSKLPKGLRIPPGFKAGLRGAYRWESTASIFLKMQNEALEDVIVRIDIGSGQAQTLHRSPDQRLSLLGTSDRSLLLLSQSIRGSRKQEIWGLSQREGKVKWRMPLKTSLAYVENTAAIPAQVIRNELVYLKHDPESQVLRVLKIDPENGQIIRQRDISVHPADFRGVLWGDPAFYVSLGSIYAIEFRDLSSRSEWP